VTVTLKITPKKVIKWAIGLAAFGVVVDLLILAIYFNYMA